MVYKHDGDGKIFTESNKKVTWICEGIIDNAKGVVEILNKSQRDVEEIKKDSAESLEEAILLIKELEENIRVPGGSCVYQLTKCLCLRCRISAFIEKIENKLKK